MNGKRDVKDDVDFAILTNEITKATFDKNVEEYKKIQRIKKKKICVIIWMTWN